MQAAPLGWFRSDTPRSRLTVKGGIDGVKILAVKTVLYNAQGIEETVRVKYFDIYISNAESIKL